MAQRHEEPNDGPQSYLLPVRLKAASWSTLGVKTVMTTPFRMTQIYVWSYWFSDCDTPAGPQNDAPRDGGTVVGVLVGECVKLAGCDSVWDCEGVCVPVELEDVDWL